MEGAQRPVSDPARDYSNFLVRLAETGGNNLSDKLAAAARVTPWTGEFFLAVKLLQDTIGDIHRQLIHGEFLDADDELHLRSDIERLRNLYNQGLFAGAWQQASAPGGPAGPESITFLRSASRQLRSKSSYLVLNQDDVTLIQSTLDLIRSDMEGFRLERADFAREALLRGCDEVAFILARLDVLGFSRLEAPVMELGAFLYTVAEDLRRRDGSPARVKRSMAGLSQVYGRLYELSKIASMAKVGWEGAHWLITHLAE